MAEELYRFWAGAGKSQSASSSPSNSPSLSTVTGAPKPAAKPKVAPRPAAVKKQPVQPVKPVKPTPAPKAKAPPERPPPRSKAGSRKGPKTPPRAPGTKTSPPRTPKVPPSPPRTPKTAASTPHAATTVPKGPPKVPKKPKKPKKLTVSSSSSSWEAQSPTTPPMPVVASGINEEHWQPAAATLSQDDSSGKGFFGKLRRSKAKAGKTKSRNTLRFHDPSAAVEEPDCDDEVKTGFLLTNKKGKRSQRRWCLLTSKHFLWFQDETAAKDRERRMKGCLYLPCTSIQSFLDDRSVFSLTTSVASFEFRVEGHKSIGATAHPWVSAIEKAKRDLPDLCVASLADERASPHDVSPRKQGPKVSMEGDEVEAPATKGGSLRFRRRKHTSSGALSTLFRSPSDSPSGCGGSTFGSNSRLSIRMGELRQRNGSSFTSSSSVPETVELRPDSPLTVRLHDSVIQVHAMATQVSCVAAGASHFACCTSDGRCFTWGSGANGQLGHGADKGDRAAPTLVQGLCSVKVAQLAARDDRTAAVTKSGALWLWGNDAIEGLKPVPEEFAVPATLAEVALGVGHIVVRSKSGSVLTWGSNVCGALGQSNVPEGSYRTGPPSESILKGKDRDKEERGNADVIAVGAYGGAAFTEKGIYYWGQALDGSDKHMSKPVKIDFQGSTVVQLVLGDGSLLVLDDEGQMYAMGVNTNAHLGVMLPSSPSERPSSDHVSTLEPIVVKADVSVAPSARAKDKAHSPAATKASKRFMKALSAKAAPAVPAAKDAPPVEHPVVRMAHAPGGQYYALVESGFVFAWGSFPGSVVTSPELLAEPNGVQVTSLAARPGAVACGLGLEAPPGLHLCSFNPTVVHTGTAEALLLWCLHPAATPSFRWCLSAFHRFFSDSASFLEVLEQGIISDCIDTRSSAVETFRVWLELRLTGSPEFTEEDPNHAVVSSGVQRLLSLIGEHVGVPAAASLRSLQSAVPPRWLRTAMPVDTGQGESVLASLMERYSPQKVAQQATLVSHFLASCIPKRELEGLRWSRKDKDKEAPMILRTIQHFNNTYKWCASTIVLSKTKKERTALANFYGEVMVECLKLRNWSDARAIAAALECVAVRKLRKEGHLSLKSKLDQQLAQSQELWKRNSAKYRAALLRATQAGKPTVPYLGCHLSDLTFLEDIPRRTPDGRVNFRKYRLLAAQFRIILDIGYSSYDMAVVDELYVALCHVSGYASTELDQAVASVAEDGSISTTGSSVVILPTPLADVMRGQEVPQDKVDRQPLWLSWLASMDEDRRNVSGPGGTKLSFRSAFMRSRALENTIESALLSWPHDAAEEDLLLRLLRHALRGPLQDQAEPLVDFLRGLNASQLEEAEARMVGEAVGALKDQDALRDVTTQWSLLQSLDFNAFMGLSSSPHSPFSSMSTDSEGTMRTLHAPERDLGTGGNKRQRLQKYSVKLSFFMKKLPTLDPKRRRQFVQGLLSSVRNESLRGLWGKVSSRCGEAEEARQRLEVLAKERKELIARLQQIEREEATLRARFTDRMESTETGEQMEQMARTVNLMSHVRDDVLDARGSDLEQLLKWLPQSKEALSVVVCNGALSLYRSLKDDLDSGTITREEARTLYLQFPRAIRTWLPDGGSTALSSMRSQFEEQLDFEDSEDADDGEDEDGEEVDDLAVSVLDAYGRNSSDVANERVSVEELSADDDVLCTWEKALGM